MLGTPIQIDNDADALRFHHLLSTNDEPPIEEVPTIRKVAEQRKSALAGLEAQIVEIQSMLKTLGEQLTALKERRDRESDMLCQYHGVLSPIRRLPPDVLIEIFLFTREWKGELRHIQGQLKPIPIGPHPGRSPLLITHICSEWRRITLGLPMLWATIEACLDVCSLPQRHNFDLTHDARLQTWLARTGTESPLDITVHTGTQRNMVSMKNAVPLPWMRRYMHRIRTLSLEGKFASFPSNSYDTLELLMVVDAHFRDSHMDVLFAPSLRRVLLRGRIQLPLFISWAQLTHFVLALSADIPHTHTLTDSSTVLHILSQCTALVFLDITAIVDERSPHSIADGHRILMPRLQTLVLLELGWLLSYLTLPALITLDIAYVCSWPRGILDTFQSRSSFSLKSLTIRGHGLGISWTRPEALGVEEFLELIHKTPSLVEIILQFTVPITSTLISAFAASSRQGLPNLAPNLEYLALNTYDTAYVKDEAILDMVTSRDPSGKPAITVPTSFPCIRVFQSDLPKRVCGEIAPTLQDYEVVHIYF
ncbi:hypothetical protein Hypma_004921 [Hypsizygus marmoreus]|uniref:F-box domain-containing protein n=1 Tax=Hypsizygus marmoreus TaxID=39966 RepID=A0A369KDG6_HYPMA|nr:hypothetical protein Hypma_004921 [Hypsizygus marmoreus]